MLNLIDVGGAGGLHPKWECFLDRIHPVIFECNPSEAEKIQAKYAGRANISIIQKGLYDNAGKKTLYLTKHFGCTSLREPDFSFLNSYPIAKQFQVIDTTIIDCVRYDRLYADGEVPTPHVIKIDVQGCEYEVLQGFGSLLDGVLGVELEAHFYPIYRGQRLLSDLVGLLDQHGLSCVALIQSPISKAISSKWMLFSLVQGAHRIVSTRSIKIASVLLKLCSLNSFESNNVGQPTATQLAARINSRRRCFA